MSNPFRYFNSSPEVIRLVVMMYVRYPLSLRNVEDLLAERGIDISHETIRFWWNRFGPMFAAEIRKNRVARLRRFPQRRWHLDEVFVKINGKLRYLWRAVDHEGEVLETVVTAKRDKAPRAQHPAYSPLFWWRKIRRAEASNALSAKSCQPWPVHTVSAALRRARTGEAAAMPVSPAATISITSLG